jgi:hypothetical protein
MYRPSMLCQTLLLGIVVVLFAGFDCGPSPQQGNGTSGGFPLITQTTLEADGVPVTTSPAPFEAVSGTWLSDNAGAVGTVRTFAIATDANGLGFVNSGRINAAWSGQVLWEPPCGEQTSYSAPFPNVTATSGIAFTCVIDMITEPGISSTNFAQPTQLPSSLTGFGSSYSNTYGIPQMRVYKTGAFVSSASATSVVNGSSATFPFPQNSSGGQLPMGMYGLVFTNVQSNGTRKMVNSSFLAMGANTTFTSPFGVQATEVTNVTITCTGYQSTYQCTSSQSTSAAPIVTLYSANQVSYRGQIVRVGSQPTALATYGTFSNVSQQNGGGIVEPANAIVTNSGSNSVTIVDIPYMVSKATVTVGAQPVAVQVKSDNSAAWVADYGDGTIDQINLNTPSVSKVIVVGSHPAALAYDATNNLLWVGGYNYIAKVDLSSFAIAGTISVSGQVTSLGLSSAQNQVIATVVTGGVSNPYNALNYTESSGSSIQQFSTSNMTSIATNSTGGSADTYKSYTMNGSLPNVALLPNGTVVSANYKNDLAVCATPTGFAVIDVASHSTIMQGSTPTPVRSIAVDENQAIAYLAVPDSNMLITVPLQ